jgi:hypothetical protein
MVARARRPLTRLLWIFTQRLWALTKHPTFLLLTLLLNGGVVMCGVSLWLLERDVQPALRTPFDGIYWAVCTVTTVGYGDVVPVTTEGRLVAIALMIAGSVVTVLYTALFASALLDPSYRQVTSEVQRVERGLRTVEDEVHVDAKHLAEITAELRRLRQAVEEKRRDGESV